MPRYETRPQAWWRIASWGLDRHHHQPHARRGGSKAGNARHRYVRESVAKTRQAAA
jgi:hypothetical protein